MALTWIADLKTKNKIAQILLLHLPSARMRQLCSAEIMYQFHMCASTTSFGVNMKIGVENVCKCLHAMEAVVMTFICGKYNIYICVYIHKYWANTIEIKLNSVLPPYVAKIAYFVMATSIDWVLFLRNSWNRTECRSIRWDKRRHFWVDLTNIRLLRDWDRYFHTNQLINTESLSSTFCQGEYSQ